MDWLWVLAAVMAHPGPGDDQQWARTLTELDLTRAHALASGDVEALTDVYATRSAAADDADLIEAYRARGGRIGGAILLVEHVEVVDSEPDRVVLDVVDRLAPAYVQWDDGTTTALPRDTATRRTVVLTMTDGGWRISAVRPAARS